MFKEIENGGRALEESEGGVSVQEPANADLMAEATGFMIEDSGPMLVQDTDPLLWGYWTNENHRAEADEPAAPPAPVKRPSDRPILAIFCYEEPQSTIGWHVANLARALARRPLDVHIFATKDFELESCGVTTHPLGACDGDDLVACVDEFGSRACNAFMKVFRGETAPITLLGHEWSAIPAMSLLRGIKMIPFVLAMHSMERQRADMGSTLSRRIEEIELSGLREAKDILVPTQATADVILSCVPDCAPRITNVGEVFPIHEFDNKLDPGSVKARYQIAPLDPMIVFLGDLDERYGPDMLVKALPPVLKNHNQTRLVIVGEGSLYWPLRVYTRYLLLEHAVRLAGSVEGQALRELIQAADVVVVPSRAETPWWPIHAAWAARRPVVATHQAAPSLFEHERDGVLVYPSENSLVWGIERVLFDADLRKTLADNGLAKLDERFGWGNLAAQVHASVAKVLPV